MSGCPSGVRGGHPFELSCCGVAALSWAAGEPPTDRPDAAATSETVRTLSPVRRMIIERTPDSPWPGAEDWIQFDAGSCRCRGLLLSAADLYITPNDRRLSAGGTTWSTLPNALDPASHVELGDRTGTVADRVVGQAKLP